SKYAPRGSNKKKCNNCRAPPNRRENNGRKDCRRRPSKRIGISTSKTNAANVGFAQIIILNNKPLVTSDIEGRLVDRNNRPAKYGNQANEKKKSRCPRS